jgi:hypothetical protein
VQKIYTIAAPAHLINFARQEFFFNQKEPWQVHENSVLGRHVHACLLDPREQKFLVTDYKQAFTIELSDTLARRGPSLAKFQRLLCVLEEQFKFSLHIHVNAQTAMNESRWRAVENFVHRYEYDNPELLVERYYQYIKRISAKPLRLNQNKFANG